MSAPSTVSEALAAVLSGLAYFNQVPAADLPAAVQAECLRVLERAGSAYTAARASVLAAFTARGAEDDGQRCARSWLKWQTQVTSGRGRRCGGLGETAGRSSGGAPGAGGGGGVGVVGAGDLRLD